jgi:hypothetical protein
MTNIIQNGGIYAKVKRVPQQPAPCGVKMLAKFIQHQAGTNSA